MQGGLRFSLAAHLISAITEAMSVGENSPEYRVSTERGSEWA